MSCQPVEVDASTAADFKGLFQTVVVRRFKNTVGIRYEMVPTEDVLQFNSYAVLYYIEDNKYIIDFRRTGTSYSRTNEKFKAKKASQQAAAEIGLNDLNIRVRDVVGGIRNDQGESDEHYNSQAGASYAGAPVNLVNKTDFKGQLQTSLLRKSKENDEGPVEITYTFSQKNNDYFEATVILTHSNPAIGICSIKGDISSTKKASEKSAAHKAVLLIQADKLKLYYEPDLDGMKSRNSSGISDYSTVKETAQDVGTALKGLFGNNFKAAAPVKTPPPDLSEVSSPVSWSIDTSGNTSNVFGNGSGIPMSKESHLTPKSQFLLSVADVDLRGTELLPLLSRGAPLQSREGDLIVSNFHGLGSDFTHPPRSVMSDILPGFQGDKYSPVIDIKKSERDTGIPNYRKGGGYIAEGDGYGDYDSYLRPSPSPSVITSAYESRSMGRRDISTDLRYCNMEPKGEPTTAGSMMRGPSQNQAYSQGDARYDRGYASMQPKPYGMPPPQVTNRYSGGGTRIADPTDYSQRDPRASLPPPGFMGHYQTRQPPSGQAHSIEMLQRHEASRLSHTMRPHGRNEGSFEEDFMMSMCRSTKTLLEPSLASPDLLAYVYDRAGGGGNTFGSQPTRPPQPFDDNASDSKTRMHSFEDEICGLQSEKKLTDWKGELQTFLARNCKDFPFKIEYNSEERVAGGKFVAKVTITFDNKDEENRVVHGIPAINKKTTERTAAGIALGMFHQRVLSIPRSQDDLVLGQSQTPSGAPGLSQGPGADVAEGHRENDSVKDWKGRLQMLLARRYRGVIFKITYDAPKSMDGIFSAFLMIIPVNVDDLDLKICYGKSSRVKKISEQSAAESAVKMLENDTLEVPSASTEKYRLSAIHCNNSVIEEIGNAENDKWLRNEKIRRALEQRKPKRSVHPNSERNEGGAYFLQNSSFLFIKKADMDGKVRMMTDSFSECALRHRKSTDRAVPLLVSDPLPDWREHFISRIIGKFHSQLESVDDINTSEPFKLTVQFGSAYFMNSDATFDQKGVTVITVAEMETALHASAKNRTTSERASFTFQPPLREPSTPSASSISSILLTNEPINSTTNFNNHLGVHERPFLERADCDDRDTPELGFFPEAVAQRRGMSNLGSRTSSGSFSGPSDQTSNQKWPALDPGGSLVMADNEGEGDHTPVSTDKEKKVEKKRRGISTGFRCSIFPLKIQNPSSSTTGSSLSHSKELSVGLADECFTVAESWLATILFSLGYQEIDGIIDDHNADTPSGTRLNPLGVDCAWQVKVIASSAYQVDVRLTSDLQIAAVTERSLCWVNAMLISGSPSPAVRAAAAVAAAVAADEAAKKSYSLGLNMIKDTPAERFPGSNTGFVNPYRTNESYCWEADAPSGRRDSHFVETFPISSMSSNQSGVKRIDGSNSRVSTIDLGTSMHSKARSVQSPYTSAYGTPASSYSLSPSSLGTTAHTDGSYGMRATDLYHTGGQSVYSGSTTHEYPHIDSKPRLINLIPPAMATQKVAPCFQELQEVMLKGVDTRIKLSTAKPLHPGDPLYEVACPMGAAPILFDKADNQNPHPSTLLKSGHKVVFAKKLLQYKLYKYVHSLEVPTSAPPKTENAALDPFGDRARDPSRSRDSIDSCNTSGSATPITISNDNNNTINNNINISRINNSSNNNICSETLSVNTVVVLSNYQQYEGDGLEDGGALVDLALEVDCSPLAQYLREKSLTEAHITREKIDIWFRSLFDHIATLCERIERNSGSQAQH